MSIALLFPGQGSQSVGMLSALAARYSRVQQTFAEASRALEFDLWELVATGPAERLNATQFTQPAMLVAGIATWRVWQDQGGPNPAVVAGHSLGEFTALVCAQALSLHDALQLVRSRGLLMQQAVPEGSGAMAAILGLEDEAVEQACASAAQGEVVEAVNYNSPAQVVIAGHASAVDRAMHLAKERGAKRAVRLPVSVPAHSSLLSDAALQFARQLEQTEIRKPVFPYISAVDAIEHGEPSELRALLVKQLASPVRWTSTIRSVLTKAPILIECGPGKVLTGLNRRIERSATCYALEDPDSLSAAIGGARG